MSYSSKLNNEDMNLNIEYVIEVLIDVTIYT